MTDMTDRQVLTNFGASSVCATNYYQCCPLRYECTGWMTICNLFYTLLSIALCCGSWWMGKVRALTDEAGSMSVHKLPSIDIYDVRLSQHPL